MKQFALPQIALRLALAMTILASLPTDLRCQSWQAWDLRSSDPAADKAAIAFDENRGVIVRFGGYIGSQAVDGTWEWNGARWRQCLLDGPAPSPRWDATMFYDPIAKRIVLFGGFVDLAKQRLVNDTWTWDGRNWKKLRLTTAPPPRYAAMASTDPKTGQTWLFGGWTLGRVLNDIWWWDGKLWRQASPAIRPPGRSNGAFCWDTRTSSHVLCGGIDPFPLQDTWSWDGAQWKNLNLRAPSPGFLFGVTSPATKTPVVFEAVTQSKAPKISVKTYRLTSTGWREQLQFRTTKVHLLGGLAALPAKNAIFNAAGIDANTTRYESSAFFWTEQQGWSKSAGPTWLDRCECLAVDESRDTLVMVGCHRTHAQPETWEWQPDSGFVKKTAPLPVGPLGIAWHPGQNAVVSFVPRAGRIDLERWNGTSWQVVSMTGSPPRNWILPGSVVPLRDLHGLLLADQNNRLWIAFKSSWLMLPSSLQLPHGGGELVALGFDEHRQRLVCAAYLQSATTPSTFEFVNNAWVEVPSARSTLPAVQKARLHYVSARRRLALVAGTENLGRAPSTNIYEWDGRAWSRVSAGLPAFTGIRRGVGKNYYEITASCFDRNRRELYALMREGRLWSTKIGPSSLTPRRVGLNEAVRATMAFERSPSGVAVLLLSLRAGPVLRAPGVWPTNVLPLGFDPLFQTSLGLGLQATLSSSGRGSVGFRFPKFSPALSFDYYGIGLAFSASGVESTNTMRGQVLVR